MPMHRSQRFDAPRPTIAARDYSSVLRKVFRGALSAALGATLAGTGCSATATAPDDDAMGAAGQSAEAGSGDGPSAGGRGGTGGTHVVGSAGAGAGSGGGSSPPSPPLAGSSAGGSGGAAGMDSEPMPPDGSVEPHCNGTMPLLLTDITPDDPIDGAEFRMQFPGSMPQILAATGELCSGASDEGACFAAIIDAESMLPHADSCGMIGNCDRYVVATRGDDATLYTNRDEVLALLGSIDSPEDVVFLLTYSGFEVFCADPNRTLDNGGPEAASIRELEDGFEAKVVLVVSTCPYQYARVTLHVATDGVVSELARELLPENGACAGRRPEGLRSRHLPTTGSALGEHFACMAHLEAASVTAFEVLAQELEHHGAPAELIASALRAAQDEVRHTALTTALARRFGAEPTPAAIAPRPLRSLEAIALDNAEEGCVRECYGAVVGCYQAETSIDAEIARAMTAIAEDETRHAALAFEIAAWADAQLGDAARARVRAARMRAADALRAELACTLDEPTRRVLGLPDRRAAVRLHAVLESALWAA